MWYNKSGNLCVSDSRLKPARRSGTGTTRTAFLLPDLQAFLPVSYKSVHYELELYLCFLLSTLFDMLFLQELRLVPQHLIFQNLSLSHHLVNYFSFILTNAQTFAILVLYHKKKIKASIFFFAFIDCKLFLQSGGIIMENANKTDIGVIFQQRLKKLVGNSTQEEVAKKVNTSRQNVGNWLKGKSRPDIYALAEIAKGFNVSTDYLLGRTEIKRSSAELQGVHEYTGLSEKAIINIKFYQPYLFNSYKDRGIDIVNQILENNDFFELLDSLAFYMSLLAHLTKASEKMVEEGCQLMGNTDMEMAEKQGAMLYFTNKFIENLVRDYKKKYDSLFMQTKKPAPNGNSEQT
ncbi:MAG: helix-turn-helix domain-containing protein [Hominimerdicola sp.]